MHLFLSKNCPTNTVLRDEEGRELYKIETHGPLLARITSITQVVPDTEQLRDVAEIQWGMVTASRLRFAGIDTDMNEYMKSEGFLGRRRVFTGPDGRSYKWRMKILYPVLFLNDESKTPIARFWRQRLGLFKEARKASLEIFPEGEHIVDAIVVSFVYVEMLRREMQGEATAVNLW